MINDAIQSFIDAITSRIGDFWSGLWAPMFDSWPLWWSWGVFILILLGCLLLAVFLQFKWLRLGLGLIVAGAGLWLFGRHTMFREMKAKLDAERAKKAVKPKPNPPDQGGGWFGGWSR